MQENSTIQTKINNVDFDAKHKPFVLLSTTYSWKSVCFSIGIPIPTCPYGIGKPMAWEWLKHYVIFFSHMVINW